MTDAPHYYFFGREGTTILIVENVPGDIGGPLTFAVRYGQLGMPLGSLVVLEPERTRAGMFTLLLEDHSPIVLYEQDPWRFSFHRALFEVDEQPAAFHSVSSELYDIGDNIVTEKLVPFAGWETQEYERLCRSITTVLVAKGLYPCHEAAQPTAAEIIRLIPARDHTPH